MTQWLSEKLDETHDLTRFHCGVESLDDWLRNQALRASRQDIARTYLWTAPGSRIVRAYYSIAPMQVRREQIPSSAAGGNSVVPAYLLGRLALDSELRGQGLGTQLLLDALERIQAAVTATAGRLIVVDAVDDNALAFYRHHGFSQVKDSNRLFIRSVSVVRLLGR
jgi:ribosomal protein S18 acetylase RimI-like enzyme